MSTQNDREEDVIIEEARKDIAEKEQEILRDERDILRDEERILKAESREDFHIQIDRKEYVVTERRMTGAELRRVPPTPIGADRDLFEVVPGGSDLKIGDTDVVEIRNGLRFFTAPARINPGMVWRTPEHHDAADK